MAKLYLVLHLLFQAAFSITTLRQPKALQTFTPRGTVELECSITVGLGNYYYSWFKLSWGQTPVYILTLYSLSGEPDFFGEFKNPRFLARWNESSFVLTISDARRSDEGMYYCLVRDYNILTFGNGVFLMQKGADARSKQHVQQPVSKSVQLGGSVSLNCTLHTETCAGEHSVYWFRHGSGESHPGIIYTHGDRSDQCEKSPEAGSPTQSCVYNLPKRNLSLSDAGTYYCAVASCGEILFGNGTMLDIEGYDLTLTPAVLALVTSNIVFMILTIGLTVGMWKKRDRVLVGGATNQMPSTIHQNQDVLSHAAVSFGPRRSSSRQTRVKTSRDAAVYSGIRYQLE